MSESLTPPPNSTIDYDEFGNWMGYNVVNGGLAVPVIDVQETVVKPEDEVAASIPVLASGNLEERDDEMKGIKLILKVPDVERWNSMTSHEKAQKGSVSNVTERLEVQFLHPEEVASAGWESRWHSLACLKRRHLPDELDIFSLVGNNILVEYVEGEWLIKNDTPLSQAVSWCSHVQRRNEDIETPHYL